MSVTLRPFEPSHLLGFEPQERQRREFELQPNAPATKFGPAWTAFAGSKAICIAGIVPMWPGRALTYALLSRHAGRHLRSLIRLAQPIYAQSEHRRIELYVEAGFQEGRRFADLLGFVCETPSPLQAALPSGCDAYLYARVKPAPATSIHQSTGRSGAAFH